MSVLNTTLLKSRKKHLLNCILKNTHSYYTPCSLLTISSSFKFAQRVWPCHCYFFSNADSTPSRINALSFQPFNIILHRVFSFNSPYLHHRVVPCKLKVIWWGIVISIWGSISPRRGFVCTVSCFHASYVDLPD